MEYGFGKKSYVTGILIAINVIVFLYLEIVGSSEDVYFMYEKGAMFAPAVLFEKEYYRLVTAMFMHFGINHIINNMIVLFALGDHLERAMGHVKYLILYLACGIGSNWISMMVDGVSSGAVSAGASGAIFGMVGGLLYVVLANKGRLGNLNARQLFTMIALSLYLGFTESGVDNIAHISGLILGMIFGLILYRRPKRYEDREENSYERY
ncbi:MAG: rhomboid family intramembrane serine protease [Lachnospiraceae bacterium]|nr:rhomboid family intramembrane serine protease [Lachnospiraceae bacterium]